MPHIEERSVTINTMTIFKVVLVGLVIWFLYTIRDVITILFIAFILSSALGPWVDWLEKRRIPRVAGVVAIAVLVFGILSLAVVLLIPAVVEEVRQLTNRLPEIYTAITGKLFTIGGGQDQTEILATIERNLQAVTRGLVQLTSGVFGTLSTIFGGVASFLTVLIISFYMIMEENGARKLIQSVAPVKYLPYLTQLIAKVQSKMGSWLRGQLLLSLIIGMLTFVGLSLLGVKYALSLAILAGFLEVIPFIGPVIAAIPAVFFAANESPLLALLTVALYLLIQQLENNIVVPKVMQQTIGLHPIIILVSLLVGARLGGIIGMIIAVPLTAIIAIFLHDLFEERRAKANQLLQDRS